MSTEPLAPAQMEILAFERATWKYPGRREAAIRERFGHTTARHSQLLRHIITLPAAMVYDAQLVKRLLSLRDERAHERRAAR